MNLRCQRGFSLTEITVVLSMLAIALVIFSTGCGYYSGGKAYEAELKANIHSIQIALERYAVDSGGYYPYMLYGGDCTDTFVKVDAPLNPETGKSYYYPPDDPGYQPFPNDFDVLIQYGYLSQYPRNPFVSDEYIKKYGKVRTNPSENGFGPLELRFDRLGIARTNIWAQPEDRSLEYVRRDVGGENGALMWDVSEGQRHPPWPIVVMPDPEPYWSGYVNPRYSDEMNDRYTYRDDYQFWLTPGNFYYYALFESIGGYSAFEADENRANPDAPIKSAVIGYHLCGYGTMANAGQDVYNLWGDFAECSLFTINEKQTSPPDSDMDIYVGPDGRRDGVIIVVDSGAMAQMPQGILNPAVVNELAYEPSWRTGIE